MRHITRRELIAGIACLSVLPAAAQEQGSFVSHGRGWPHAAWPIWASRAGEQFLFDANSPEGYRIAQYLLRDVRANRIGNPDLLLLRIIAHTQAILAAHGRHVRFDITSGLRTHATNSRIEGAAQNSMHLPDRNAVFRAADFVPRGLSLDDTARLLFGAGVSRVSIYRARNFLHADTAAIPRQRVFRR